jgi:hypothetical protein
MHDEPQLFRFPQSTQVGYVAGQIATAHGYAYSKTFAATLVQLDGTVLDHADTLAGAGVVDDEDLRLLVQHA